MLLVFRLDEELKRADPVRAIGAQNGRRNVRKAEPDAQQVRRDLALAQRALLEIPERALATRRFIDRVRLALRVRNTYDERVIRTPGDRTLYIDFAASQELERSPGENRFRGSFPPARAEGLIHD